MSDLDASATRRTVLVTGLLAGIATLGSCSASSAGRGPDPASPPAPSITASPSGRTAERSGTLVAHFSRAGENYWFGDRRTLAVGNTQRLVDMISDRIERDTYEIMAADPYPAAYAPTVDRNVQEMQADVRPVIANPLPEVGRYRTVLLGSPVWAAQAPLIMSSFIEFADLDGATVLPFVTYAVSGMAGIDTDYRTRLPQATVRDGLTIQGERVGDSGSDLDAWLREHGLVPT